MDKVKLKDINSHPRDENITFAEICNTCCDKHHVYTIKGIKGHPVSTTETIGKYYEHFDANKALDKMAFDNGVYIGKNPIYSGKSRDEIKLMWESKGENASKKGTASHQDIENFFNGEHIENPDSKEHKLFLEFWANYKEENPTHEPYRNEWLVYDDNPNCEKALAGSIDFVVKDENGELEIIDWKFVQEIKKENSYVSKYGDTIHKKMFKPFNNLDDCNFSHYFLQLNFYRHILETLYGKKVKRMRLIILHSNQEKWEEHEVERMDLSKIWHTLR